MAIANLALDCGQIGRPSTGIMALRGQSNVQGASNLGPLPATLPGYQSITDEKVRDKFEQAWGRKISKESVDFLVVQDIFHTETTRFADVILPGASFAEKDGTFTNGERPIQRVRKAVPPVAGLAQWRQRSRSTSQNCINLTPLHVESRPCTKTALHDQFIVKLQKKRGKHTSCENCTNRLG
jgi:formate dehydrogenase major subunit/formate dehydrogenase alpha subunit